MLKCMRNTDRGRKGELSMEVLDSLLLDHFEDVQGSCSRKKSCSNCRLDPRRVR